MRQATLMRRGYLGTLAAGVGAIAGCTDDEQTTEDEPDERGDDDQAEVEDDDTSESETEESDEDALSVFYVSLEGDDTSPGTESQPLRTIHEGLQRAEPGDTIQVASGEYEEGHEPGEPLRTIRSGEPNAPITVTGPEDAIVRPSFQIRHSHIHLTGLTIEGLLNPENTDDPTSYGPYPIRIWPMLDSDDYLEDIVCAPHGVGYGAHALIRVVRTKDLEIGPLEVTGIAGASWILPNEPDRHAGEIVYLGTPPEMPEKADNYPWDEIDQSRHVHIHHIDNSEGHPHSQLVDAKAGTRDVLIEYCTDAGGSQNTEPFSAKAVNLNSYDATVRWCDLRNGEGRAVQISTGDRWWAEEHADVFDEDPEVIGTRHSIYGNRAEGFEEEDLMIQLGSPDEQEVICGNEFGGVYTMSHEHPPTKHEHDPSQSCPADLPQGDGIGHTGGRSSD